MNVFVPENGREAFEKRCHGTFVSKCYRINLSANACVWYIFFRQFCLFLNRNDYVGQRLRENAFDPKGKGTSMLDDLVGLQQRINEQYAVGS